MQEGGHATSRKHIGKPALYRKASEAGGDLTIMASTLSSTFLTRPTSSRLPNLGCAQICRHTYSQSCSLLYCLTGSYRGHHVITRFTSERMYELAPMCKA